MSAIDVSKQVVQMVFDNGGFEKNASESLETIQKLKDALNFDGAVRGLENLKASASDFGMGLLSNGVYKVQEGFSALDVVATRVLQNITDKVQNIATDLAEKVTIEPLRAGLQEYETQINSVQTILANTNDALMEKGLTTEHERIEKINGVLDDLNHYADMTIYNFTEMTRNIGTFTAAGVDLDTAATSIKGIANLAAMSGSNSQQASTAMYQLSQAIAAGSVKLQDWNSVVNAGMGGKLFQNELIDTAKAMGVADEQFVALTQGATTFRESLSSGWISADVLTNTLEKFTAGSEGYTKSQVEQMQQLWRARGYSEQQIQSLTGSIDQLTEEEEKNLRTKWAEKGFSDEQIDHILSMGTAATDAATKVKTFSQLLETVGEALQSGWTQSWEYIIGDFEQAKMLWTEISDIMNLYIGKSADARNKALAEWSKAAYSYNEAGQLIRVADGQIVEGGKMVAEEMGGREAVIQGLRNTFQGLFEIAIQFSEAWNNGFWKKGTNDDISTGDKLIKLSRNFQEFTDNFKKSLIDENGPTELLKSLRKQFDRFAETARNTFDGVSRAFSGIKNILSSFFNSSFFSVDALSAANDVLAKLGRIIWNVGEAFRYNFGNNDDINSNGANLIKFFNGLYDNIKIFENINFSFIESLVVSVKRLVSYIMGEGVTASTILGDIGTKLSTFADALNHVFTDENGASKFSKMFNDIVNSLKPFIDSIKEILNITTNGSVTGLQEFFNQMVSIMNGKYPNINLFDMFQKSIESLLNIVKAFISVAAPVWQAFTNSFGPALSTFLVYIREIIDRIHSFTDSLVLNKEQMNAVYTLFKGIFDVIQAVGFFIADTLLSAWDGLGKILHSILPDGHEFSDILTKAGTKLSKFADKINEIVSGESGSSGLSSVISTISDKLAKFFEAFKNLNLLEAFIGLLKRLGDGLKHALGGSEDMSLLDVIIEKIKGFLDRLKYLFSDESGNLDFVKIFETGGIGLLLKKLFELFKNTTDLSDKFKNIADILNDFKDTVGDAINDLTAKFKAEAVKTLATSMLEIAGALFIIAAIDPVALGTAVATITAMFRCMERLLEVISGFKKEAAANLMAAAQAIKAVGIAILEMSIAVKILGEMNPEDLVRGLLAVTGLIAGLVIVAEKLSGQENMMKGVGGLVALAFALDLLVIPVKVLGEMDFNSLVKGLGATIILMGGLTGAAIALSKWGKDFKVSTAIGLILMAEGIKILADAVMEIKDISWEGLAKGLSVFAIGLGGMVGAAAILSQAHLKDDLLALGIALVALGASMKMLSDGLTGISQLTWEDLAKGLAVFAVALVGLGIASYAINGTNLLMIGGAIFLVATAISELAITLGIAEVLGPLCTSIALGLSGIKDSLLGFANNAAASAFLDFIQNLLLFIPRLAVGLAQGIIDMIVTLGNGAAQIVEAVVNIGSAIIGGIGELLPQIFGLVKDTLEQIFQLLIDETPRLFETLGVFFNQLWPFLQEQIPQLFATLGVFFEQLWPFLSGQVDGFFSLLTTFFTDLFTFLQTEGPMLVETIRLMIDTVLQAIIAESPVIAETFLALLQSLLTTINTAIPEIIGTLLNLITTLLVQLAEFVPQMAQSAMEIILGFLRTVAENLGEITKSAIDIALAFIKGITEKLPEIIDSAFKLLISFINGLADAIRENHNALFEAIGNLITSIVEAIIDGIGLVVGAGDDLVGSLIDGIGSFTGAVFDIACTLVQSLLDGILNFIGDLLNAGCQLAQNLIDGIGGFVGNIYNAACELIDSFLNGIGRFFNDLWNSGRTLVNNLFEGITSIDLFGAAIDLVQGFIDGIWSGLGGVWDAACGLANEAWNAITESLDEHSPSRLTYGGGKNFTLGFINGMSDYIKDATQTSVEMAENVLNAFDSVINSDTDLYTPSIAPVIDASNIQNGINSINDFMYSIPNIYGITADITQDHALKRQLVDIMGERNDYSEIMNGMHDLKDEIGALGSQMAKMQIIMDSGVLVGAIVPEIDSALGTRFIMTGRGVY